jgi:hypothetical protein
MESTRLVRFIDEPIEVIFQKPPMYPKSPPCPDGFIWRGKEYQVTRLLAEWHDYGRRGRMSGNMRPEHAVVAQTRGSLGVGRFHFIAECGDMRFYELYYDRAPKNVDDKKGHWYLVGEHSQAVANG